MRTICPHCNTPNRPLAKFCLQCVTPLPAATVAANPDAAFDHEQTIACTRAGGFTELTDGRDAPRPSDFSEHALPVGTLIEGFRILKPIGEGGFGIVYLAWDCALERHVAIKEYMPASLAVRSNSLFEVSARSERDRGTFDAGLKSFVNEARLLARFDHPALVKVLRFWEGNRTAYMAMPYYEGPTLKTVLAAPGPPPSEEQLRIWLRPLLVALATIHRENCYHRDISPDNILLTHSGPVLLDFGAARRVITDMTQALTAVLKPGFAPIEQYGGEMMQGPWTDLYALAGVVHYAITGRPPLASAVRIVNDTPRPLAVARAGHYSDSFLRAIDAALSVRPEGRPQDVAQFCALLGENPPADNGAPISRPAALPPATPTVRADRAADAVTSIEAYPSIQREVPLTLRMPTRAEAAQARGPAASNRARALVIASLLAVVVGAGAWRM
ncbi:MAG: protein kinase, partial [Gammaproteobacteria bacterium]|nr:protein kinase [Gammaproteobacteria bacterium]